MLGLAMAKNPRRLGALCLNILGTADGKPASKDQALEFLEKLGIEEIPFKEDEEYIREMFYQMVFDMKNVFKEHYKTIVPWMPPDFEKAVDVLIETINSRHKHNDLIFPITSYLSPRELGNNTLS